MSQKTERWSQSAKEKRSALVDRAILFRNRINGTNCSAEDIMRIYIGTPLTDYFACKACTSRPKKLQKRNYSI